LGLILILRQLDGDKQQTVIIKSKITLEGSNFFNLEDSELSNELMWTNVVGLSNEECRLYYGNQIGTSTICVGGNYNEGSCYVSLVIKSYMCLM
jgi:hypothetical protein